MKIYFLFTDNFPGSSAYANRIHSLAKGLTKLGNQIEVSIVYPGLKNDLMYGKTLSGIYDCVRYKYYCGVPFKPVNDILRKIVGAWGILRFSMMIYQTKMKSKIDFVILCSSNILHIFPTYILSRIFGYKVLREKNEYPKHYIQGKRRSIYNIRYVLIDGFIFMTYTLEKYFKETMNVSKRNIVLPMTVDLDRFKETNITSSNPEYLALVGDIVGEKDGARMLIDAFAIIHKAFPKIRLKLVGDISNKRKYDEIRKHVKSLKLAEHIEFTGIVRRETIPDILCGAKLLLLPRPISAQAESGFPTKLGEYLASAVPTIVTDTGEITMYIENEVHALIIKPNDVQAIADAVIEALCDYPKAIRIGRNGQSLVKTIFNYEIQTRRLEKYLLEF